MVFAHAGERYDADSNRTEYVDLVALRADVLARAGRWVKAQSDAKRVCELRPEDFGSYHRLALLTVANKDVVEYRHLCQRIVSRFHQTDQPIVADQMAKDCLILPSSGVDLDQVAAMADIAVNRGQLEPAYPFFQCCKALAEYRQGHFDEAVKWAQHASMIPFLYSQAEAYAILSMGQYKLNQADEARTNLMNCEKVVQTQFPTLGISDLNLDWRDWIIGHALLSEAQNLIGTNAASPTATNPTNK
jgi:eukaryotic-like serine/threonine-protein kinase